MRSDDIALVIVLLHIVCYAAILAPVYFAAYYALRNDDE